MQEFQGDPNTHIKIKLLDDLVEQIMSLPDAETDKPEVAEIEIQGNIDPNKKV